MKQNRKAFTMLELIFVIAIIGILVAIVVPKFAVTRNDAIITRGKNILASVRSSIALERQKRILRGDFTPIIDLSAGNTGKVFDKFSADRDGNKNIVLQYSPTSCTQSGCWSGSGTTYTFHINGGVCTYLLANNHLNVSGSCTAFGE